MSTPESSRVNRRGSIRKKPRGKVTVEMYSNIGLGPNLAHVLWDLSQTGACLICNAGPRVRDDIELFLSSTSFPRRLKLKAEVVWVQELDNQMVSVGLRFSRGLTYMELQNLT
ncbi:MAG TPA: PilZ domain-containing protein [Gemmatales bacterium]|nr:PilZ domain-containing protein [Gemmatales bacterium]HMP61310.1 PilZ domain-containing protein [Gemmatales bacterium]